MVDTKISKFENFKICVNIEKIGTVPLHASLDLKKKSIAKFEIRCSNFQKIKTNEVIYFNCFYVSGCAFNDRQNLHTFLWSEKC